MIEQRIKCDVCGNYKTEGNRWLMGWEAKTEGYVTGALVFGYAVADWDSGVADSGHIQHFCGEQCMNRKLSEYIRQDRKPENNPAVS